MNAQELAARLNGREYGSEITKAEEAEAKAAGLVVVFGHSDDIVEFHGAIIDEVGAYDGTKIRLTGAGLVVNKCDSEDCPYHRQEKKSAATITAVWCPENTDGTSWAYKTAIPHHTFNIMDHGDLYCIGIVFALADVDSARPAA